LVWQQDLGAATLFFFGFLALLYISTGELIYLMGGGTLLLLGGTAAYFLYDRVNLRINAWLNPWPDATDRAFQIVQSLYAIGAGGILGTGFGQGYPTYIPVVHSDFTLAAIAEEWGIIGTLFVIVVFIVLVWRALRVAALAEHPFSKYLAAGIAVFLAIQSILIIGGVGKLLPLTGVTLPFVSYGGSSMVISSIMVGLVIWLSQECYESDSPHAADK
ncbi:MAG: FtsW/RodA/SpoVE family cell cycle protein, partial [Chloroflexota bacterium]